jgi:hypothetical protein
LFCHECFTTSPNHWLSFVQLSLRSKDLFSRDWIALLSW